MGANNMTIGLTNLIGTLHNANFLLNRPGYDDRAAGLA
jgi:hypothetical protein